MSNQHACFDFDGRLRCILPRGARYVGASIIERSIRGGINLECAVWLSEANGICLFIQTMRRDRERCRATIRIHTF